ncbi:MAG: HDIG domain-containing protein [Paludibacteraceae bacterium]|nr:HDIG domain-containing protein [Paludibacteraceae bacterium]
MKKEVNKRRHFFDEVYKTLAFLIGVALLSFLMPHQSKFQYQFELGKPWQYDLLTATFDFPIYKSADDLQHERNAIIESQHPYFDYKEDVKEKILLELNEKAPAVLHAAPNSSLIESTSQLIATYLDKAYEKGIMSNDDYQYLLDNKIEKITVTRNKIGLSHTTANILPLDQVIDQLKKEYPQRLESLLPIELWDFEKWLQPNVTYNEELTLKIKNEELNSLSVTSGMIQAGERIIDRGELVTEEDFRILESLKKESSIRREGSLDEQLTTIIGQTLLVTSFILLLYLYLRLFRKQYFASKRVITLLLGMIIGMVAITSAVVNYGNASMIYIIPYALIPIITSIFFDTRTGLYTHYITIFLASFIAPLPFEFILLQAAVGMVAITTLRDISQRSQLVNAALAIVITYSLIYLGYGLTLDDSLQQMNAWMFAFFFLNGILLLLVYPFVYVIEQSFGFISNMRLIELSDVNSPLMRKLSEDAPGTFQHSMQVANLASEIANKIGGNPMLARTGALYHDIGKVHSPAFFVENQAKGNNPHQYLTPEASAQIIRQHVLDGVSMAKEAGLPRSIIEFIETHHGKSMTRYFYNEWCNKHPDQEPNMEQFTYQGPNPYTKELAIVMICDTVEAASRSLNEYTDESISNLVEKLVNGIIAEHYLDKAPITLREISEAKEILKEKLANIYHTRIAYPELKTTNKTTENTTEK